MFRSVTQNVIVVILLTVTISGCSSFFCSEPYTEISVSEPTRDIVEKFDLSPHYQKCVMYRGLPIVSSEKVNDFALKEAHFLIGQMTSNIPEVIDVMAENKVRVVVMSHEELTTSIPEHSGLTPPKYWDRRARGLGAIPELPATSCGEENLLDFPGDPYPNENVLIHEFAHSIHLTGLNIMDETFDARLTKIYQQAVDRGLWKGTYAGSNKLEYFAMGTQSWFHANRENDDHHNHVNTRAELIAYDPDLAKLVREIYGETDWHYQKPAKRNRCQKRHLKGYKSKTSPHFKWPKELQAGYEQFEKK